MSSDSISVVIVTYNSMPALADCLHALKGELRLPTDQVVVVDNGSLDGSLDACEQAFPEVQVVRNRRNRGFGAACNQGAEISRGEYLLFLNPDVVLDQGAVAALRRALQEHPEGGLAAGRMRFSDGRFQPTCRVFPTSSNILFSRGSLLSRWFGRSWYTLPDYGETTEVEAVAATCVMIRRAVFNKLGGFDERFFMFMEDTDLSLRLYRTGYANVFVPTAGGSHGWGQGARAGRLRRAWLHHHSVWQYFLKHTPNGFSMILLPLLLGINLLLVAVVPQRSVKGKR